MSLRDLLASCAAVAFTAIDDIPEVCQYAHLDTDVNYDWSTGKVSPPANAPISTPTFVFEAATAVNTSRFTKPQPGHKAPTMQLLATAQASDFVKVPVTDDVFFRGNDTYVVLGIDDTAIVIYILWVGRISGGNEPTP